MVTIFMHYMSSPEKINNVFIVVPAYNESDFLRAVVARLSGAGYTIVVVDDGSSKKMESFLAHLPKVYSLRHKVNLGQGAALQTGIEFALKKGATHLVTFDGDGQHSESDIPALLDPLLEMNADVSLGSRFLKPGSHNASVFRKWILNMGRLVNYVFTGLYLSDAHNGLRAMTADAARKIQLRENRMAHATEFLLSMKKNRLRWKEVPVTITYTDYSRKKGQSVFNSIRIFFDLVLHKLFE